MVESFSFLRTTITNSWKWASNITTIFSNITTIFKKSQQRLLSTPTQEAQCLSTCSEKILFKHHGEFVHYLHHSLVLQTRLQRVVHLAEKIIGYELNKTTDLYTIRTKRRAVKLPMTSNIQTNTSLSNCHHRVIRVHHLPKNTTPAQFLPGRDPPNSNFHITTF